MGVGGARLVRVGLRIGVLGTGEKQGVTDWGTGGAEKGVYREKKVMEK